MSDLQIKINGKELKVAAGCTVLEAATQLGYEIPTLCHAENLKPFTSCFMCAVKIEGGRGNMAPACATKVTNGMSVIVEDEEIAATRRMCLDLLLSDHCGDCRPPCETTCPANIDIRGFLALVKEGKEQQAAALIREKMPFPGILGRICPHECETVCRRNRVEDALAICSMKRHIADTEKAELGQSRLPRPAADTGKKIAIVGGGPAGMSAAYYSRLFGHQVTVFEKAAKTGGMLRYGIPYYRLPDQIIADEMGAVERLGVEVKTNCRVGGDIIGKDLEKEFDGLILAIGSQAASSMRVEGENLPGVISGVDFLRAAGEENIPALGKKVIVIGGGNTAMDAARTALRCGSEVTILYRRTRAEMPAHDYEIDEALEEGVKIEFLTAPQAISQANDGLSITCVKMELGPADQSGRRRPQPITGSERQVATDNIISAIGQKTDAAGIADLGIALTRWGDIQADSQTMTTNRPGIFACGDCQTGPDVAIKAAAAGRQVAVSMNQFLTGLPVVGEEKLFNSTMGPLESVDESLFSGFAKTERLSMPVLEMKKRQTTFTEVETGYAAAKARQEAERCLTCGCDADQDCKLRAYATKFEANQSLFKGERRLPNFDQSHQTVKMEAHKCINCAACVRACAEVKKLDVLTAEGRGFATRMTVPFGRSLVESACDGCGECVKVCPTAGVAYYKEAAV